VLEFQINSLLSGLGTPLANAASVAYKQVSNPLIDMVESLNPKSDKHFTDIIAGAKAMMQGFGSDLIYFKSGWVNGYPLDMKLSIRDAAQRLQITEKEARKKFTDAIIAERVKLAKERDPTIDTKQVKAALEKNFKPSDEQLEEFVRESYDYMRGAIPDWLGGKYIRMPTKLSVAIDEYGKARFRRYKIAMLASRKAREEAGQNSKKYEELYNKYMKQSMEHVKFGDDVRKLPEEAQAEAVKQSFYKMEEDLNRVFGEDILPYKTVKEYALREMFQQRLTGVPKKVQAMRHEYPATHLFIPFMKTPWNITKEGSTFIPVFPSVMKKYLGPDNILDANGIPKINPDKMGAYYEFTNEELIARQILGGTAFLAVMGMVQSGNITGKPRDAAEAQAWKDAGIPQSSIKVGDTWIAYDRIEPIATVLGLSAEIGRTWQELGDLPQADKDEEWASTIGKGTFHAIKANIMQKSFIEGFNSFFNDVVQAGRTGTVDALATAVTRQYTPALLNQIARAMDPYERQATTTLEKIQQRIPLAREELPIEYGLTGGPRETNAAQVWTSFNIQAAEQTPLQRYIYDLGVTKMREDKDLKGVDLNNDQLARLRQLSNEFVTPRLERYVASERFQRLPESRKKFMLDKIIDRYKRVPRQRFYNELRRTDPKMALKFKNELYRSRGMEERMQVVE
jgi:hypothetical protein